MKIPAAVRFVSVEPMLGFVNLAEAIGAASTLDWVICGGESGPKARPMNPDWPKDLRDQCIGAGVPFMFKQWGEWQNDGVRVGKKRAGRHLQDVIWDQYPKIKK